VREAPGLARPDWELFAGLAAACGADLGFETLDELHEEMGELLVPPEVAAPAAVAAPAPARPTETTAAGALTLFSYPLLVDDGRLSEGADELKATLAEAPFVELHPDDAAAAGIADGAEATLRTTAGSATLPARVTPHVARGAAFVPFNQEGFRANRLFRGDLVEEVTLEPVEAPVAEGATT
jgi:NADH-quinone oxidoreductase subunit G